MSSGVRFISPPQEHFHVHSSTNGLCKSKSGVRFAIWDLRSLILPMHSCLLHFSHTQIGNGVPQKRSRDNDQSLFSSSQLPKRPLPTSGGYQLIVLFNSTIRCADFVVAMYHESRAYWSNLV